MNTKETKKNISQTGRNNWIVYRHIRIDKNVPFYIGIGKGSNRAYDKKKESIVKNRLSHSNRWKITINGDKYNSLREAAKILNLNRNTIKYRILSNNFKNYERKEN